MFETLEARQLFAGGVPETLVITGTDKPDQIYLIASPTHIIVTLNGVTTSYPKSWFEGISQFGGGTNHYLTGIKIDGGNGNDSIWSWDGSITLPETVSGGAGADSIEGGAGNDCLYASKPNSTDYSDGDTLDGEGGNDKVYGASYGLATLYGGNGNDLLSGGSYKTIFYGAAGNDTIIGAGGPDSIVWGGSGDDSININGPRAEVHGEAGADNITVYDKWDGSHAHVFGDAGNDTIKASGNDQLYGGDDNDFITDTGSGDTGSLPNQVDGGNGMDYITTGPGNDTIQGGYGDDSLDGGTGNNYLWGLDGNDTLTAGSGNDTFFGGAGSDMVSYATQHWNPVSITLDGVANDGQFGETDYIFGDVENAYGSPQDDTIIGSMGNNMLYGGGGKDLLRGGNGADSIWGGAGDDTLHGDVGDDQLFGEIGSDLLYGGMGYDQLYGGDGQDTLVSIGGGNNDYNAGGGGVDSFWIDSSLAEQTDATPDESAGNRIHKISGFLNSNQVDPLGQDLIDPGCSSEAAYTNNHALDNNPLFGVNGPAMDDIRQRQIGDCYFMSAISSIALEKADDIKEAIVDMGDHTYAIRMWNNGQPEYYRVDDNVPINKSGGSIRYAWPSANGAIWAPMLEKAFVFHKDGIPGSYESLDSGAPSSAYNALGLSYQTFGTFVSSPDLKTISDQLALNRAVTVMSDLSLGDFEYGDKFVVNHVYSVVSVDLVNQTITLRNPWGTDAGGLNKGGWSDGSDDGYVTFTAAEFADDFDMVWSAIT